MDFVDAYQETIIWDEPRLSVNYRRYKKFDTHFWSDYERLKHHIRFRLDVFVR